MPYTDLAYLEVSVDDRVATVVLNGPEKGNALTFDGQREVSTILPRLADDDDVAAVVVTGADDAFCAGPAPDFLEKVGSGSPVFIRQVLDRVRLNIQNILAFPKPLVSAVNGPVAGAPMALALLADIIIAERQVRFSDQHVPNGVTAGDGNVLTWPLAMGVVRAKRFLLTGESLDAEEAERLGLVTEVVGEGGSLARATAVARQLAGGRLDAIRYTKLALNGWLEAGLTAYERSWAGEILTVTGA